MPCASAFLTSDWEIPNCLAIADGLTPALKAARTAFSLPVVNEPAPSSAASWRRCGFASATGFFFAGLDGRRPRRSASVVTAASSVSISTSSNRFSAPAKSFGKKWRCCEARLSGPALPFGPAEGPAAVTVGGAEKRSGVVSAGRRVGMPPTMPSVAHRGNGWQGLSQPFREVTFCASYKSHCLGSCGSRLSWLWGEGVPSRVARGAPNSAAAARDDLAPAYPTLNM
jgi:hypothetical protein